MARRNDDVGRFLYWSERRIRSIAGDNGISLGGWRLTSVSPPTAVGPLPLPQASFSAPAREADRRDMTIRVRKELRSRTEVGFDSPPPTDFAEGVGRVEFARFIGGPARDRGVLLHTHTHSGDGRRVDVILFGSLDNTPGFRATDAAEVGWTSSAWLAVSRLLEGIQPESDSFWGDTESVAFEALKIALHQGCTGRDSEHAGRPWTRGFTLGRAEDCEWFAEIYADVVLDHDRWAPLLRGEGLNSPERILIGAPVWARTASPKSLVRYARLRARGGTSRRWFLPFRRGAAGGVGAIAAEPGTVSSDGGERSEASERVD
ncbi:hypothetical protein ABT093_18360 [Kitasatospora sp. NPDC002551]|uniref:hypothetical protein n=1 Tax=unclassified Kitasatospora TaxID=2633591 RepID=UPI0033305943